MNRHLFKIAFKSAWNRKGNILLAILVISLSLTLLLSVDSLRKQTKQSFLNTVSGTDLIVGARSGSINLLLYSVFHIGNATNNMRFASYEAISKLPQVDWAVPISLGDSHRGYRVIGTSANFYQHFKYADDQMLKLQQGKPFADLYDAVIGAQVAKKLGYQLGDKIVLAHGMQALGSAKHDDKPFVISGVLAPTGTPVDHSIQVSLEAIEAIHIDWRGGQQSALKISPEITRKLALKPKQITAMMVGLKNPLYTFKVQRTLNEWRSEPLSAILPGATLAELWKTLTLFEKVLLAIASMVLISGLISMLITLISTLNERRREMAVLRAIGLHSWDIIKLFMLEAGMIMLIAILFSLVLFYGLLAIALPIIKTHYGLRLVLMPLDTQQWLFLASAVMLALILSLVPGWMAYRRSLADGLSIKS